VNGLSSSGRVTIPFNSTRIRPVRSRSRGVRPARGLAASTVQRRPESGKNDGVLPGVPSSEYAAPCRRDCRLDGVEQHQAESTIRSAAARSGE
jgi:hypothetical protein